jgi:FAD/FMN-containing dehydrogenase
MTPLLIDAAKALKGSLRRPSRAKTVSARGPGGQVWAEAHLRWNRQAIRQGRHELRTGMTCLEALPGRRREPAEEPRPRLPDGIRALADARRQADPKFQTNRLSTRIGAAEVRRQWIATRGYADEELPTQQAIDAKLDLLGFRLTRVAKCRPQEGSSRPTPSSSD